ncbi:DUF2752 domain-containing protein [Nocardia sp. SYP-A9097]|uniref:DUF2752 domain-containing protein n=1 Tax=Nocardia sp. SYP-A9097 TaxID=2663237 RepID=UPI00132679BC|nr:DUF2752 domain-containing protein [Nocardia sp. SYP-A9097]MRH90459.1 DUF2752 domain-containing protein [Nocardia sp. SYP-A9097]
MDTAQAFDAESATRPRWLSAGLPLLVGGAVAGGLALLHFRDPHEQGSYGICPFKELTGWWCPGCGGLRGLHNLTEGHVLDAIHSNILLFPLLLGFLAWWGTWLVRGFQGKATPPRLPQVLPKPAMWVTMAFLLLYTVLRNTPWGTWLAPV